MRAGGNGYDFRLGLAGAIRVREKPTLGRTPVRKDEQATGQEQDASLIDVFHERILAPMRGRKSAECGTFASATKGILPGRTLSAIMCPAFLRDSCKENAASRKQTFCSAATVTAFTY